MEMVDFSRDIFSRYRDREKGGGGSKWQAEERKRERTDGRAQARQIEKWKANILAMRT